MNIIKETLQLPQDTILWSAPEVGDVVYEVQQYFLNEYTTLGCYINYDTHDTVKRFTVYDDVKDIEFFLIVSSEEGIFITPSEEEAQDIFETWIEDIK